MMVGVRLGTLVGVEVAEGFTGVGATVTGKGEAGAVIWPGVQAENTPLKLTAITSMVMKW